MVALLVFIMATLEFLPEKKNCWTQEVHFAVTFLFIYFSQCNTFFFLIFFLVRRSTVEKHVEHAGEDEAGSCHPLDLKKLELDLVSLHSTGNNKITMWTSYDKQSVFITKKVPERSVQPFLS